MAQLITIKGTPVVAANEVLVADSNSKIPAVDGSAVTAMAGGNIAGTIPTARLDTGTTANKLVVLGATGLPAVDGSLLTGIVSHTTSASDPTISTNPSGGVGSEWINSTSGKQFICTDATAGENVWKCSGSGSGDVQPWAFTDGGKISVYKMGGNINSTTIDKIEKISVTSDGNSTDISNLIAINHGWGGSSSETHGYCNGGSSGGWGGGPFYNTIQKFQFSTDANATDVGDLTTTRTNRGGHSMETHGYVAGGSHGNAPTAVNIIERYPYASDTNSSDVGDLIRNDSLQGCCSDTDYGYTGGGEAFENVIERYQFAASANGSDVGNLVNTIGTCAGHSGGTTYGFISGGGPSNVIQRITYASSGNSTDWADLTWSINHFCGSESTTYGYGMSGYPNSNVIQKFPFATQTNATDVGDLSQTSGAGASAHN